MKLKIICSNNDCFSSIQFISDALELSFFDGEPEDNNLNRNFNDCYSIENLIKKAYEAGKNGEVLEIEKVINNDEY